MKAKKKFKYLCYLSTALLIISCSKPVLTDIEPSTTYPRQILSTDGSNQFLSSVVWDNNLSSETTLKSNFLSSRYFQLPDVASTGNHPVVLKNGHGKSVNEINVSVLSPSGTWPAPRIEDIGINNVINATPTDANFYIAVSAANADADAVIQVGGVDITTIFVSAIPSDFLENHIPATYGYPIYHYTLLVGILENQAWDSTIQVTVKNHDAVTSPSKQYKFAASLATLDSDNDGLLDEWEKNGYTVGGTTIDLKAMGCDPKRKDVLVEVDWISAAAPDGTIWATIEDVFEEAPILNPDGSSGISMHLDRGQGGAFTNGGTILTNHTTMDFGSNSSTGYVDFYTYKNNSANFDPNRKDIFHYGIFGRARPNGSSGRGEVFGNDFMVTFFNFTGANAFSIPRNQIGTFVHEFGHNINLCHGGACVTPTDWNETFKVNQPSSMNYRYQFPAVSDDCDLTSDNVFGFSRGMLATLNETNVNEANGICDNNPLDFNGNGATNNVGAINLNGDGNTTDISIDYNEWGAIRLDFTATDSSWNNN